MKRRISVILAFVVAGLAFTPPPVFALKKRVPKASAPRAASAPKASGISYSRARLSRPTNSVQVTFTNMDKVSSIDYLLTYRGNGLSQGAGGSVRGSGTETRDVYFGTCSHGVCTPHRGISGATLLVTANLKSGATHVKRYRIKV